MPELNQLQQLVMIAEAGTISKAAEQLHLSQPALTRSVQKLEAEWNVSLFERTRNRVTLNETGDLAVQYARQILNDVEQMTRSVQLFERAQHTISIGSCAPAPILELLCALSGRFGGMKLFSETVAPELLLPGLQQGTYQVIITDHWVEAPDILCQKLCTEHLFLVVPPTHPLAAQTEGVWARELAGLPMLVYKKIGVWQRFIDHQMVQTDFIVQDTDESFATLLRLSEFPSFATDLTLKRSGKRDNRIYLPFLDPEATLTFYCCAQTRNKGCLPQ